MKKTKTWLILAVLLIAVLGLAALLLGGNRGEAEAYRTATARTGDIKATVASTGKLAPLHTVKVGSQVSGNIKELYADYNSVVKKDQVVALIDPEIYQAHVKQAEAQLNKAKVNLLKAQKETAAARAAQNNAQAQLFAARAIFREAELDHQRKAKLTQRRAISTSQLDAALARKDNAQGSVRMAQAKLVSAQAQIDKALALEKFATAEIAAREAELQLAVMKLNHCTIRSPIDGVVITRAVDVGQTVAASLQSPLLFIIAEDLKRMQVEVDVSEADVGQIRPGQEVEFTVDAFQEQRFQAKVNQVRNSATSIQNVVTYKIVADVDNDRLLLRPGMTANVTIVLATVGDTLKIPNAALRFKPLGKIGQTRKAKRPPISERPFFKKVVRVLSLDQAQAREFEAILGRAKQQLKAAYSLPEDNRDPAQAWRAFFKQVFSELHTILRQEQYARFAAFRAAFHKARHQRGQGRGRRATVYLAGEDGPVALPIHVGISDETETQVIGGELKAGDKVIVGLALASEGDAATSGGMFMKFFRGGK
ncbi:MAG: efflux RND transporter periplasmic adaptor subunit [Desulfarculaceae bacterium]|nr:efflux RND transporter periplasmic adaptor subunit [Desulfarculaceae bacterium]MCF8074488.1 efflux RND transporter periplasmic adaptor subunit [Desulfarculaceae bacterium]MCF8103587.1 efflux RND transporter periplasmic adaptor subunit [Desulfarculaceae bacterium]MCF8118377.1 efflux RND transporter periplasmic adaptor subunit [Desulfarculaceae bacterium]